MPRRSLAVRAAPQQGERPPPPPALASPHEQSLAFLRKIVADGGRSPIGDALGFRLVEVAASLAVFEGAPSPASINPSGAVHGGYAASMLESACICALQTRLAPEHTYRLIDLQLVHHQALPKSIRSVRAEGRVIGCEGSQSQARAALRDDQGVLLATASATFSILAS